MSARAAAGSPEAELARLEAELRQRSHVTVCWLPRSGGIVSGGSVHVLWPGESTPRRVSDAELATLRMLELNGQAVVTWPFNTFREQPAPLAERIETAAATLALL